MHHSFETPDPIVLYVELDSGDLRIQAEEVTETTIVVDGPDAEDVTVEQRGEQIAVIAPRKRGGFMGGSDLVVTATIPTGSDLATKLGSADLVATGRYGQARVKTGSGDLRIDELGGDARVEAGSGDITINSALGALTLKSGSGNVNVDQVAGSTTISTGSGDVSLGTTRAATQVKSGSGDVDVRQAHADLDTATASGDVTIGAFHQGSLATKCVSGDLRVGIPAGIPVWTDIHTLTGDVRSRLAGAGQPEEGQPFIELRATTVSGDVYLEQLRASASE